MFHDLHVPWNAKVAASEVKQTLLVLEELGYNIVALSHTLSGKLPADLKCAIPEDLPFPVSPKLRILRRCTLILSDPSQNHRLSTLASNYDILALRPTNDKSLQQACQSLECDIISLDLRLRFESHLKMKMLAAAIQRGIKFEICYSPAILSSDSNARRNVISNATELIRATRGRGLIISSEATKAIGCRAPADVINLAALWGLGQERGKEALEKLARSVVVSARMKRTSYRGVIDVVDGGQKEDIGIGPKKRKADEVEISSSAETGPRISKRARKKQEKAQRESEQQAVTRSRETKDGRDESVT